MTLKIKVSLCNILWQLQEQEDFDNFADAWNYVKDKVDDHMIKMHLFIKKEKTMQFMTRFFKVPDSNNFMLTGNGWEEPQELDDVAAVQAAIGELIDQHS